MTTSKSPYIVRLYVLSISLLFFNISGFSQASIAAWDFANWNPTKLTTKTTAPVTTKNANLTVSNLTMGSGIALGETYYTADVFGGTGTSTSATTLAEAITKNEYFEFTLTPVSPKLLTVSSIAACFATNGIVRDYSLFSSINGFTAAKEISKITSVAGANANIEPQTFAVTGYADLSSAVTFRIYTYGVASINWTVLGIGLRKAPAVADIQVNGSVAEADLLPPTMPGALNATSVGANSLRLNWTISTDDNEVVGYDVYNGLTFLGSTTSALFYSVFGLTPETNYTFRVIARDLSGKSSAAATVSVKTAVAGTVGDVPKLPIGMNIPGLSYYTTALPFTDAMTMSGDFMSFYEGGGWSSTTMSEIPRDVNGYPTQIPVLTSDGQQTKVRTMLNSYYNGRYVLTFDGVGTIAINGIKNQKLSSNKYYIDFDGSGNNVWMDIVSSTNGNQLRNFKILPLIYENSSAYPTFNPKFLDGLRPFHALRFMDWIGTNGSKQVYWSDRATKTYYSQATSRGASYEYAIELCNELDVDAWVTVPHQADDNYIIQTARLWRDGLRPNRKVYVEYSNEIWNWMFYQAGYCLNNAPGHPNAYVTAGLNAISAPGNDHPEKDAYMMARNFRLWKAEFTGANAARMVRVAAVQHGWTDNTRRVLNYLFDVDKAGCDVVSPGGYFNYTEADHNAWLAKCVTANPITPAEVCLGASTAYDTNEAVWTDETAGFANARGIGYVVYEGGQHMQPWMQGEWCYNQAVWDAQINPKMYELYVKNFRKMVEPNVNCSLFMAFAYMGQRESKYGSWGHLENMEQIGSVSNYMTIAPKYQALLDANSAKTSGLPTEISQNKLNTGEMMLYPNPASDVLNLDFGQKIENVDISVYDMQGRRVITKSVNNTNVDNLNISKLNKGVYILRVNTGTEPQILKFVKN